MVRLTDLLPSQREHLAQLPCPRFESRPWVVGGPLSTRRVALVSSAGLMMRGDRPVTASDVRFRPIAHDADPKDVLMSHVSVNYDRTGFQRDPDVVLPRRRLQELADAGVIGAVAVNHYSSMGAVDPVGLEGQTRELAATLKGEGVDSAVLLPV